ncbi:MAG: PAS domain-containing protein [Novosphingobium sp.]|nr:PAS domain-containing protein [Novosphingobium sp.]
MSSASPVDDIALPATSIVPPELTLGRRCALQSAGPAFHALADTMPQMIWSTLPDGDHDYYNAQWYRFTGVTEGSTDGEGWAGMFHADDRPVAWKRWRHSLETGQPYEVEYRLRRHDGVYRWVLGRALPIRDAEGQIQRWIGTCTDIEDAKEAAQQNEILSRELSHRIKNIFAVISALMGMTARSDPRFAEPARTLQERIAALGRAHEFVRPHSETSRPKAIDVTLNNLLSSILSAYPAMSDGRISISGGDFLIHDRAATPVALTFHELATNSLKYGALSSDAGRVAIVIEEIENTVALTWTERDGPRIETIPELTGFGSKLTTLAVEHQLGGTLNRDWREEGLKVSMTIRSDRIRL